MLKKALMFFFAAKTAIISCNFETKNLPTEKLKLPVKKEGKLDRIINESSGLCSSPWSENLLTINDSGGKPELYEIDHQGNLINRIKVTDSKNKDWEEITTDDKFHVYIGDFGNNSNQRQDLTIYKFNGEKTDKIHFRFSDQTDKMEFDCEAFFWHNDSLYLFTKSWEKAVKNCHLYVLPDIPGNYTLSAKDQVNLKAQITGASINPAKTEFALIAYGKILRFSILEDGINFNSPINCMNIAKSQTEAIFYQNDSTILFTNEQGKLFKIEI